MANNYLIDMMDVELNGTTARTFVSRTLGEGDIDGNRFGIRVYRDGKPESLSGKTCIGYLIRQDGVTAVLLGAVSGNTAYVELPAACYAVEGQFTLAIKICGSHFAATARIVDGTVTDTTTETIIDPTGVIPDLSALLAVIADAEAAADAVNALSMDAEVISGTRYRITITKEE